MACANYTKQVNDNIQVILKSLHLRTLNGKTGQLNRILSKLLKAVQIYLKINFSYHIVIHRNTFFQ